MKTNDRIYACVYAITLCVAVFVLLADIIIWRP